MPENGWRGATVLRFIRPPAHANPKIMTIITDPLFYALAIPAVIFLGLSKGGFSGIGMVSTPLLALMMPPLEAAAILLPIILLQDVLSCWIYRRDWDPWNLKVMLPGGAIGVGAAWLLAAYVSDGAIRLLVGLIALGFAANAWRRRKRPLQGPPRPRAAHGVVLGRRRRLHLDADPDRRPALLRVRAAAAAGEDALRRHHGDVLRPGQLDEGRALFRARPVLDGRARHLGRCCSRSRSPPTFSASGWCASRPRRCSTRSPMSSCSCSASS